jgi:hypothetical protein
MEPENQNPGNPLVSRAMYNTYLVLLYLGLLLLIIGIPILADGNEDESLPWLITGVLLTVAGSVLMLIMFYRFWDFVIRAMKASGLTPSIETPGKAIGYLFIPFYNFYWIFQTFGKLPKDLNALATSGNIPDRLPEHLGNTIAVLVLVGVIPYVGYVTSFISAYIMLPVFIRKITRHIDGLPDKDAFTGPLAREDKMGRLPDLESIHDHTVFFNSRVNGINLPVGIAFFLGLLLTHLIWMLASAGMFRSFPLMFGRYYLPMLFSDAVMVTAFLLLIRSVRKNILLFVAYGITVMLLGLLKRYVFSFTLLDPQEMAASPVMLPRMINDFLFAALFMAGVVYSIRYLGLKWWTIGAGLIAAYLAAYLLTELIGLPLGSGFYFSFRFLTLSVISAAIQGFSIWYGIWYFALKRGIAAAA